jgi:hypothetical protein
MDQRVPRVEIIGALGFVLVHVGSIFGVTKSCRIVR